MIAIHKYYDKFDKLEIQITMRLPVIILLLFVAFSVQGQVGIGTTNPDGSSSLEISSVNSGLLIPRVPLISNIDVATVPTPAISLLVYNTNTVAGNNGISPGFYFWNGSIWEGLGQIQDADWFEDNTITPPNAIGANIYTQGNVGINDATPDYTLDMETSSGDTILNIEADLSGSSGTDDDNPIIRMSQDGGAIIGFLEWGGPFSDNSQNQFSLRSLTGDTNPGTSNGEIRIIPNGTLALSLGTDGQMQFNQYTTPTSFTGTTMSLLGTTTEGNIVQESLNSFWRTTGNTNIDGTTNFIGTTDNNPLVVRTNNTERMRVDEQGNVFVNTNTIFTALGDEGADVNIETEDGVGLGIRSTGPNLNELITLQKFNNTVQPGGDEFIGFRWGTAPGDNASIIGHIETFNGLTVLYDSNSDERLKTNITPSSKGLEDLMKIEVVDYIFKSDKLKRTQNGFLAQQLYEIYPHAVAPGAEDVSENPWGVDYGKVTPLLVKAIQEQQELIKNLEKRIEALEKKN